MAVKTKATNSRRKRYCAYLPPLAFSPGATAAAPGQIRSRPFFLLFADDSPVCWLRSSARITYQKSSKRGLCTISFPSHQLRSSCYHPDFSDEAQKEHIGQVPTDSRTKREQHPIPCDAESHAPTQRLAHYSPQAKSGPSPMFVNKVLWEASRPVSRRYGLRLLSRFGGSGS